MAAFVEGLLDTFHQRTPIRAGSLIITVFGDAVVPRGGVLSMASLIEIMRAFRVSESLVRTALSRLVSDGWFVSEGAGTLRFDSAPVTGETETRILPTGEGLSRPTAPTTVLDGQRAAGNTR